MKTIVLTLTLFPWAMISIPTVQQYMGTVRYHWGSRNLKYPKHMENYGFKSFEQYAHLKRITYKTFFTVCRKVDKNLAENISPGCLDMMEQLLAPNPDLKYYTIHPNCIKSDVKSIFLETSYLFLK